MSVVRHERRSGRFGQASPYSRTAKKSSWSFLNIFSFLNPLRSSSPELELPSSNNYEGAYSSSSSSSSVDDDIQQLESHPAQQPRCDTSGLSHSADQLRAGPPSASQSVSNVHTALNLDNIDGSSPAKNLQIVAQFLTERAGTPLSEVEVEGLISLIHKSAPPEKHVPFRFSTSISPSPELGESTSTTIGNQHDGSHKAPRMLSKNPNGTYRWRGCGSAKPSRSRNRYSSPAFGPSRILPERLVLKESTATGEGVKADNKRRRVGEEADNSSSVPSGNSNNANGTPPTQASSQDSHLVQITSPSIPRPVNGASSQPKVNGAPAIPSLRLRTHISQKPTTPAVPSPLRQTWSGSSSESPPPVQTSPKPTKAANFMAELIKEVTPPKKPDVSNPYQTASPVKIVPSRQRSKRPRATGKPTQVANEKEATDVQVKEAEILTPQAIIEATLPKACTLIVGSKRSRPPSHFEKPIISDAEMIADEPLINEADSSIIGRELRSKEAKRNIDNIVEEVEENEADQARVAKKPKPSPNGSGGLPGKVSSHITVEEVKDIEMAGPADKRSIPIVTSPPPIVIAQPPKSPTTSRVIFGSKPSSVPKEPSKLRYSYQPEGTTPSETSSSVNAVAKSPNGEPSVEVWAPVMLTLAPKEIVLGLPTTSLPSFTFSLTPQSTLLLPSGEIRAREQAKTLPAVSLPTFPFNSQMPGNSLSATSLSANPVKGFDWTAAGINPPPTAASGNWTCSICMLSNPPSATDKCTVCDSPR
ncbi:hypothetical protein AMATHDRAFT_2643 [Amanita thiersii Skay4041]|uniref:RanBP2-type domain-containing protein n=1 Tax=Amanita thiersii Skay4041 TaxID=703135 RepID=A0A2A9NVW3_9AGAR|nr:hypothetical protein AMATHDRAFT_2643 [Amanita thiersii Skay4041]